jgi:hypothetical protein
VPRLFTNVSINDRSAAITTRAPKQLYREGCPIRDGSVNITLAELAAPGYRNEPVKLRV